MAEFRHLENRHDVIFFCREWSDLDKISQTSAEWHVDCGDIVEIETRCRIPIWRTFGRIQWHAIPEPPATVQGAATWRINVMIPELRITLQGAATGRIQWHGIPEPRITLQAAATLWIHCHDSRATCHIAGCSHLAKSMSYSCHIACCKNSNRHIENRFSPYFIFFRFLKCSLDFDERQLPYCLRYTYYYYYCQTLNIVCQPHWAVNRIPDVFDFVENFAVTQGQSVIRICTVE